MQEQRTTPRTRTYYRGQIDLKRTGSVMDCLVRNISTKGAKLAFADTGLVPREFDLSVHKDERSYRARVVWRRADEAGVTFVETRRGAQAAHAAPGQPCRRCEAEKATMRLRIKELSGSD